MPVLEVMTSSGLGSLLGMRHALEPDHLAAVSTLVTGERSTWKAAFLGMCWGLGHTLTLVAVGAVLVILRGGNAAGISDVFELGVALMLIGLGLRAIYLAARQGPAGPVHVHHHGGIVHVHRGAPAHIHIGAWTLARRPLLVGAIHGLAGSGALTALVLATLPSTARGSPTCRVRFGIDTGHGRALGSARLAARAGRTSSRARARRVAGRRLRVDCARPRVGLSARCALF